LLVTAANAINASLYPNLSFNFIRDIAPVAGLIRVPLVMVVNPSLPAKTVPEFIAYAKANPGKISMATGVNGGAPHVAGELFKLLTGTSMVQVPYKGLSLALSDLLADHVQVLFSGIPAAAELIRAGKLRALAVTTVAREEALPDLPSVSDFVPGSWTVQGTTDELANDFPGWHPDVQAIIRNIETPFKWALMVRGPMPQWSEGRVTLLGDACHPTLPFLGQGGVMAIEDSYVIAECLKKHFSDPANAMARYEDIRRERTSAVVRKSHENRRQAFNPALSDQDEAVASVAEDWQQTLARERQDWLYTYDATAIQI